MSDPQNYFKAQAETREASALYNLAAQRLKNRQIWERFAEIQSQHDPLNKIIEDSGVDSDSNYCQTLRALMIAAARYVTTGRVEL